MHVRFRWTFLLTLVAASLVAAPLAVTAADLGTGLTSFGVRSSSKDDGKQGDPTEGSQVTGLRYERAFAPVMEGLGQDARNTAVIGSDWVATASGFIRLSRLGESPRFFRSALETAISQDDVALVHFGDMPMDSVRNALQMANVTPLGEVPNNAIVVTGVDELAAASLARAGATVLAWTPGFFTSPEIGITPVISAEMAASSTLNMFASVFPGTDEGRVTTAIESMGGTVTGSFNSLVAFRIDIDDLRSGLETLAGLNIRALSEQGIVISQDEDTAAGLQLAEFRGGDRPYTEAGILGDGVIIGVTDTGLSLDTAVLGDCGGPCDLGVSAPAAAGPAHRKVVAYVTAQSLPGNAGANGDLLTCDGVSGATHGHVVSSIIAGNASDVITDIRFVSGFEPNIAGTATTHAIDGMAPLAKIYFVDDQVEAACVDPEQIEAQTPGILSTSLAASTAAGAKIHNFSFAIDATESQYTIEAQDLDTWLHLNQDYLVVVAAGNKGNDGNGDGNLDFGTVTSPGTAKNILTVGASGYPNDPLNLDNAVIPQVPNRGIEIISRFVGGGSGQGPAAFSVNGEGGPDWRIKPDVMAPGDEVNANQRMTAPATCISNDGDQAGPVECSRLLPGVFTGTSFAAAGVSGAAAMVVDYFDQGFGPTGQAGGAPQALSGPELKAALIASADLMTGQPQFRQLGGQLQVGFYNPRHLSTFTPEQGYGRVQLNKLLPLSSEPGTPTYISSESISVPLAGTVTRSFTVANDSEPMRCAVSWYDKEATLAGTGELVRNLDMEVRDCGADTICGSGDDELYYGNFFSEDANFDRALLDIPAEFVCSNDPLTTCDPNAFDPVADCGDAGATCIINVPSVTEDCNSNGALDFSEFSLPVSATMNCPGGGRDVNNNNEAVFLSADQLSAGRTMEVSVRYAGSTEGAPAPSVDAGLVCTGGIAGGGTPDAVRLNKPEYTCADSLVVSAIAPGGSTAGAVGGSVTVQSFDEFGGLLDTESGLTFSDVSGAGTAFDSLQVAVVDATSVPPSDNDLLVGVESGGSVAVTFGSATGSATVRCSPSLAINNIGRRGTNANFGISGGCDPRGRIDPRILIFGLIPGTGATVNGDLFMDKGEDLNFQVAFTNQEEGGDLLDVIASLKACAAGSILPDGSCTPAAGITILDPQQSLGNIPSGRGQLVSFNVRVGQGVTFPQQIQMVFGVSAAKNGLTVASESIFNHVLETDTWSFADEDPLVSGASYYSTDFPTGGREVRVYGAEFFDPLNPDFAAEEFLFQDMTTAAFGGGNAQILGFNPTSGKFDTPIANNMPWTFDLDDEAFGARRRFDSDPGDNLELQSRNVWQWNNTGECGFQSNDAGQADWDPSDRSGVGGMWHSGHAESQPGTPAGRTGYDLGCENYDMPGSDDPKQEQVIDSVSSPIFFRVHQNTDANGFAYSVEFLRLGLNLQYDVGDGNAIFGYELDPDTTTSQPVDPLDFGWLQSDQGTDGFLSGTSQGPYVVFNPNDPHDPTSAATAGLVLNDTPGPGQNIRSIQGAGSPGPFYFVGDGNKAPARSFGEITGVLSGRGIQLTWRRGAAGLPVRNTDLGYETGAVSFEDIFGPNETRDPDQTYPITGGNPESLINRRDSFQANVTAILGEEDPGTAPAISSYGVGFDDVVVEWREIHPVADRTPCSDPSTWAYEDVDNTPIGESTTCLSGTNAGLPCSSNAECPGSTCTSNLAAGCAVISWDRNAILAPEETLGLTVIDSNAAFGPDGIPGTGDEQAVDSNNDGFSELVVPVSSDADLGGELITLTQIALGSSVYSGTVAVSSTKGLTSNTDGTIFIQENGDGTSPTTVSAQYSDQDINVVGGVGAAAVPCPDNPRIATVNTQFVGTDVAFVTATVQDVGPNADGDLIADPGETIQMDIVVINSALDLNREKPDLLDVSITLVAEPSQVGETQPIACILDGESFYGTLPSGLPKSSAAGGDSFEWVVGNVSRGSVSEVLQARFRLGIVGRYIDSLGVERNVTSFATPQSFAINLDLDLASVSNPLVSDSACVGGDNAGRACAGPGDCPNGSCDPIPGYLASGGSSVIAGQVGYFEGFEGHTGGLDDYSFAGGIIAGTSFEHYPAVTPGGGYLDGGVLDYQPGPLTPGAIAGAAPDIPEGSSGLDGTRCQYNDPRGPSKHPRSEGGCRPWDGSAWHVKAVDGDGAGKAFSGVKSLYSGVEGRFLGVDSSFDGNHTNALNAAFSGSMNVGVAGGATLSVAHIVQTTDDRTFNVPAGNAAGRGYLEWAEVDPATGVPVSGWNKLNGFQNNYGNTGVTPFFVNCVFDAYDDFYSAPQALGGTPGFDIGATSPVGVTYNADEIGSEDDYFDPNDPLRLFGPSAGCYPQFVFASLGDYTSTNTANAGKAFTEGELGETGNGVWVKSLFNLDQAAGRTIRVRFTLTDIDIGFGALWVDLFGNTLGNAFRGWILDDVAVSGLVDAPIELAVDTRTPGASACPVDPNPGTPDNEAACNVVTASAGIDVLTPVSGSVVTLDASASTADSCVNGHLEYQWRIGGSVIQSFSTNPSLIDAPLLTTEYTVDVRCSVDKACNGADSVLVVPADELEASGQPTDLMTVAEGGGTVTFTAQEPPVGGPCDLFMLRTGLKGAGELRTGVDGTDTANVSSTLRNDLCNDGTMSPVGGGAFNFGTSSATGAGVIDGYVATSQCGAVVGTLGRLELLGVPGEASRGRLSPSAAPACP